MDYTISVAHRRLVLQGRIHDVETEHYNVGLTLAVAQAHLDTEVQTAALSSRLAELEIDIGILRAEMAALPADDPAGSELPPGIPPWEPEPPAAVEPPAAL